MAMYKVKITVIEKILHEHIADKYLTDGKKVGSCDCFEVGDSFIADGMMAPPKNFCPFAWNDIFSTVLAISRGGTFTPWDKTNFSHIACCTDGVRPVTFLIERDEEMKFPGHSEDRAE
ncbi:TIGR04076 family protein [Tepidanaerobacter syntrophicus]|uniref:TIGR04076 family protein n=1 Tax=Tepidanaerobacter syntrophicus TaxID=224999 RepID=UPI001BD3C5BE|nr:TIGR04076 family protein [Tepidanaerobacter syntrophicus]